MRLTRLLFPFCVLALFALGCVQSNMNAGSNSVASRPDVSPTPGNSWSYDEQPDKMGRGVIKTASVDSINTVSFNFPYNGEQHARLTVRKHPEHGNDVMLRIERGQFLTGVEGCTVTLRFDDNPPIKLHGDEPADLSTNVLFIEGYDRIVSNLERAKRLRIEAPFYQEGNQVFDFDVQGFKRERLSPQKSK
jgi:hypothetical protein